MGRLRDQIVYLAGPIDSDPNRGTEYRKELIPILRKYGIGILSPLDKSTVFCPHLNEDEELHRIRTEFLKNKDYENYSRIMKEIVRVDLSMVDAAHFLIIYIDKTLHMCGTYHELVMASIERKPCLIVCRQGMENIPPWLWGIIPYEFFFSSFEELDTYLSKIDNLSHKPKFWRFFDMKRIYDA